MLNTMQKALTLALTFALNNALTQCSTTTFMANKKYVYIQLYPKDLLADEKLAKCDNANAWGAYLALLNIMAMEPVRGCVRLGDWDTHPNNERKSLVTNFRKANSLKAKATAFARIVAKRTPLKIKPVAEGICQLVSFGVVEMYDDALIQPRMFREGRGRIEGYNPQPEQDENVALRVTETSTTNEDSNEDSDKSLAPAPALRANMRDSFADEDEYNKNSSSSSKRGVGEISQSGEKATAKKPANAPPAAKTKKTTRQPVGASPPSLDDVQAYFDERRSQQKPVRYIAPDEFMDICTVADWTRGKKRDPIYDWKAYLRQCDLYRERHGDHPIYDEQGNIIVNSNAETTTRHSGAYQGQQADARDRDIIEQSQRIIERKLRKNDGDTQ